MLKKEEWFGETGMKNIVVDRTEYWLKEGQETAIVLLHGIGAIDPENYWRQFLKILLHDPIMKDFGVFVWKYPTHTNPGGLSNLVQSIKRRTGVGTAPTIKRLGEAWKTTYSTQFSAYKNVILVCHSMGGLVVKSWIIDTLDSQGSTALEQLLHISFYATPHNGAPIATLINWNHQLQDMKINAPFIKRVSEHWHNQVVAWKGQVIEPEDHRYNCNRYIPHLVIAGLNDEMVPAYCATIQGIELTTVQGDHSQVIQPINEHDTRYKVWRDAVQNSLSAAPYLRAVVEAWVGKKLDEAKIEKLTRLASDISLAQEQIATIEREVMGDTKETIWACQVAHEHQEQYRREVEKAWAKKQLNRESAAYLTGLVDSLDLDRDKAATIEREVMGDTKEEALRQYIITHFFE